MVIGCEKNWPSSIGPKEKWAHLFHALQVEFERNVGLSEERLSQT